MNREGEANKRPGWQYVVTMFFLGWTLIYANRNVFSAVLKEISAEWSLSRTELGLVSSAFFLAYTIGQIPAGFLADRFSRKALLLPGYYLQAIACAAGAVAPGPTSFLWTRIFSGAGQSTYYSPQFALAQEYLPNERRAFGAAAINAGMGGGVIAGLVLGSGLVYGLGLNWRIPFVVVGALSVILALAVQLTVPESHSGKTKGRGQGRNGEALQSGFDRNFWMMWLTAACTQFSLYLILTWLPYYLQEARGFSGSTAGLISSVMPLVTAPAGMAIGFFSDRSGTRRSIALWLVPMSTLAIGLIGFTGNLPGLVAGLVLYGLTGKLALDPLLISMATENIDSARRASVLGVLNFASTLGMVSAPAVTGYLADVTGSFSSAFVVAVVLGVVATITMLLTKEGRRQAGQAGRTLACP